MFAVKVDQPAEKKPWLDEEDFQALKDKLKARKKIFKVFAFLKLLHLMPNLFNLDLDFPFIQNN